MLVTRIVGVGLLLSAFTVLWPTPDVTGKAMEPTPDVISDTSLFRTESDLALARWAVDRFDRADLQLPPVSIAFHDDKAACDGHFGYFRPSHSIDICGFNWNRFLVTPKKTLLHELAHAWTHETLDSETRDRFLDLRGLDTWQDNSVPWEERGVEHAAEVMAWGLMDEELFLTSIGEAGTPQLAEAFELLTGRKPLR